MFRLSDGEKIMTLAFFRFDTIPECDGQTDGRTDGHVCSGYTSACIACYANALVKIWYHFYYLYVAALHKLLSNKFEL